MLLKKLNKLLFILLSISLLVGCSSGDSSDKDNEGKPPRDTTPQVKIPEASGANTLGNSKVTIDISNNGQGYVMIQYNGSNPKVKIQITNPDASVYTYDKHDGYETFPLTGGNGNYQIGVYENVSGNSYNKIYNDSFSVTLENDFITYLYPSQYVNFTPETKAISKGQELAEDCYDELDVVTNVFNYMVDNVEYDYDKAASVQTGYLPVVDDTLDSEKGICFDYAALMATMLRTQGIPTRLEIGYAGEIYHAWISVYTAESGWVDDLIQFDGQNWQLMDPTFTAGKLNDDETRQYVTDKNNYQVKYLY